MAKAKLPETTKVKLAVLGQLLTPGDETPYLAYSVGGFSEDAKKSWASSGYFFIREEEIEITLPQDFDIVRAQLDCMKVGINAVRAEMQNKISTMIAEMQKFEALAWNGSEE